MNRNAWIAAFGLLISGTYLAAELYLFSGRLGFPLDDSWIHLQFARQLAEGQGLAYQDGRWVGGSTAPLWTALLALGFWLPISPLAWAKLLGMALFVGVALATDRLAALLDLTKTGRNLAIALVLMTPWLAWSALSGMEILLFAFLSLGGMILHLREKNDVARPPLALPIFAVAALARPEGLFLLGLATLEQLRWAGRSEERRPLLLHGLCLAVLALLPTFLVYRWLGGDWLPTTFAVKGSTPKDLLPSARYLQTVISVFFRSQPLMLLLAGAGVLRLVENLGTRRDRGLLPALWLLGLPLAYALLAAEDGPVIVGNFGRYYFPLLPMAILLGVLGVDPVLKRLRKRFDSRWLVPFVVFSLLLPSFWLTFQGLPRYLQNVANVEDSDVKAARWLAERLPPEAVLAVQDIGAVKYLLPNSVIDLAGIVNPEILPYLRGTNGNSATYWEQRLLAFLEPRRPDYLLVFARSYPMLSSPPDGFRRIHSFEVPNNVTMAGDELVLVQTPWARAFVETASGGRASAEDFR